MNFKFYENFFDAINLLPEGEREKACYEFCKYGITGELPEDKNLAMFCLGVSVSVQKYQGRGGKREGSGRKKSNDIENQKNQNEQTETETKTKTKTIKEKIKEKKSFLPPSLEEIKAYCIERKNNVDPKRFFDYYSVADWKDKDGKAVKNWKQKLISVWEAKTSKDPPNLPLTNEKGEINLHVYNPRL